MPRPHFNQSGIRHTLRPGYAPKAQNGIEDRQRKQSPEKGLCKDMSEEGKCKEMPKTGQRKTTDDRPMYKRPNDRSMQGSTGMLRPRFNQSGIRHTLRYGAAPKAQNGIEESQRKQSPEEGQCKEMPKTGQRKTTGDRPMPQKSISSQC